MALIPAGATLLHHLPNDTGSYENGKVSDKDERQLLESAGTQDKYRDCECIIVEAPGRREEFLPRLEEERHG